MIRRIFEACFFAIVLLWVCCSYVFVYHMSRVRFFFLNLCMVLNIKPLRSILRDVSVHAVVTTTVAWQLTLEEHLHNCLILSFADVVLLIAFLFSLARTIY